MNSSSTSNRPGTLQT